MAATVICDELPVAGTYDSITVAAEIAANSDTLKLNVFIVMDNAWVARL